MSTMGSWMLLKCSVKPCHNTTSFKLLLLMSVAPPGLVMYREGFVQDHFSTSASLTPRLLSLSSARTIDTNFSPDRII